MEILIMCLWNISFGVWYGIERIDEIVLKFIKIWNFKLNLFFLVKIVLKKCIDIYVNC